MRESLEKMLAKGVDNPLLRFGLGKAWLDEAMALKRRCTWHGVWSRIQVLRSVEVTGQSASVAG